MSEEYGEDLQDVIDGCDPQARVSLLLHHRKQQIIERLDKLESEDPTMCKSLYREYKESFMTFKYNDDGKEEVNFEAVEPFYVDQEYLKYLADQKRIEEKYGD